MDADANTNPIHPAQNPNSGNTGYSLNISLYPSPDTVSTDGATTNSGLAAFQGDPQRAQLPPPITQNGKTISIPVPIPNSLYQRIQKSQNGNIGPCTSLPGFSGQTQFSTTQRENSNFSINRKEMPHRFGPMPVTVTNSNRQLGETGRFPRSGYSSSTIPLLLPPPPPPPPQYLSSTYNDLGNFDDGHEVKYNYSASFSPFNKYRVDTPQRETRQLNQSILDELKELNLNHRHPVKSYSFSGYRTLTPLNNICSSSSTKTDISQNIEERSVRRRTPPYEKLNRGSGDNIKPYVLLPEETSTEMCDCELCSKERIDWQNFNKIKLQEDKGVQVKIEEPLKIPHIPQNVLWKQMDNFRNNGNEETNLKKFVDKATCPISPMHTGSVDNDSSPVWEFVQRDGRKYRRILSPESIKEASVQCDLSLEAVSSIPKKSTEILGRRVPKESSSSTYPAGRSPAYHVTVDKKADTQNSYVDYTPANRLKTQTFLSKINAHYDVQDQNGIEYDDDFSDIRENMPQFAENSNKMVYSHLENQNRPRPTAPSMTRSYRASLQEVMKYLDGADDEERQYRGFQSKSSMMKNGNPKTISRYSQLKRNDCNSNIYSVDYETRCKQDFQQLNPPKKVVPKRTLNFNQRKDLYTEVVCRRPPADLFPESLGPLDFPEDDLQRVLTFLDSNYWQQVMDGFRLAVRLARHHPEVLCEDLGQVVWKAEKHLASLKSAISRAALASFTEFILHVRKAMEPFVDKVLGKILTKSMDCNKFLRWECRNVLNALVCTFPVERSLSCLESGLKNKSEMVRATVSVMLNKWVQKVGADEVMSSYADRILPMIIKLLQERGWEARAGAKDALTLLFKHPNFMRTLRAVVSYEDLVEASKRVKFIKELMEQDCLNFRI